MDAGCQMGEGGWTPTEKSDFRLGAVLTVLCESGTPRTPTATR